MLRMKPVGKGERGARRAELYYAKTDAGVGYYRDRDGLHSEWLGQGAITLDLAGRTPDYEHFKRLLRGLDPWSGDQLTARLRDDRIPCWDLTVSMPKGPTLAIERGDGRVLAAFRESYREAFALLERYATTRVRLDGRQEDRVTGNLVAYVVEHPDTRPVEDETLPEDHPWRVMPLPDRHAHLVVANETWDAVEGRWKAVKFRPIMDLRKYFDRCFDAIFAAKLADLGYEIETEWRTDARGRTSYYSWDIKGMPAAVLERLSKRSQEIDTLEQAIIAERKELDPYAPDHLSPVERDRLGATSRRQKRDDLTLDECRRYWETLISPEEGRAIAETIRRAMLGRPEARPEQAAARAADFAMRHHFEAEAAVPLEQLVATALEHGMGSARPGDIERELTRLGVLLVEQDGRTLATTHHRATHPRGRSSGRVCRQRAGHGRPGRPGRRPDADAGQRRAAHRRPVARRRRAFDQRESREFSPGPGRGGQVEAPQEIRRRGKAGGPARHLSRHHLDLGQGAATGRLRRPDRRPLPAGYGVASGGPRRPGRRR